MSPKDLTPEQVATIDHRLDQTFAFIRDVVDDPVILGEIPSGSRLRFRDVAIGEEMIRLTAYPDVGPAWSWTARVTGPANWAAAGREPVSARPGEAGGMAERSVAHPEHGYTADDALSALEEKLRNAQRLIEAGFQPGRRTA
jgi:hypothetical protein